MPTVNFSKINPTYKKGIVVKLYEDPDGISRRVEALYVNDKEVIYPLHKGDDTEASVNKRVRILAANTCIILHSIDEKSLNEELGDVYKWLQTDSNCGSNEYQVNFCNYAVDYFISAMRH